VPEHSDWNSQTGVICQEVIKFLVCGMIILVNNGFNGFRECFDDPKETLKTMVPAFAYLIQNNLQYVASSHLQAPTYAVLYQLKIVSTAFLSVLFLGRVLKINQWIAIVMLTAGVALVSISRMGDASVSSEEGNFTIGLVAILTATLCSGFSGVFFEKMLKDSKQSMFQRNFVLAFSSVLMGLAGLYFGPDKENVMSEGFFHGYTNIVWLSIANNALGGLLIAAVIKYADNILKNFATGFSIINTVIVARFLFGDMVSAIFGSGVLLVFFAVPLYAGAIQSSFLSSLGVVAKKKDE
jgi:UDP-sugar transporter A1/2/3